MNCKPGDLCLIVKGWRENVGRAVVVVRLATAGEMREKKMALIARRNGPIWIIDRPVVWKRRSIPGWEVIPGGIAMYPDSALRPIPPLDDQETVEEGKEVEA